MIRRTLFLILLSALLAGGLARTYAQAKPAEKPKVTYVGSSRSSKYHKPSCRWAKRIKNTNLVTFSSRQDAEDKGYIACKVCKP